MSDGADSTSPPQLDDARSKSRTVPRISNLTLSEAERDRFLESIDRQLEEIDGRASGEASESN